MRGAGEGAMSTDSAGRRSGISSPYNVKPPRESHPRRPECAANKVPDH